MRYFYFSVPEIAVTLLLVLAVVCPGFSQSVPQSINYQGIARDASGNIMPSKAYSAKISVLVGGPFGPVEYQEIHSSSTNEFGLFTFKIGLGAPTSAGTTTDFSQVEWSKAIHYMDLEIDFGSGFLPFGTMELASVPYALLADSTLKSPGLSELTDVDTTGIGPGKLLKWDGTQWVVAIDSNFATALIDGDVKGVLSNSEVVGLMHMPIDSTGLSNGMVIRFNELAAKWEVKEGFYIDNFGNVGIGTSSPVPGASLEVIGRAIVDQMQIRTGADSGFVLVSDKIGSTIWTHPDSVFKPVWELNPAGDSLFSPITAGVIELSGDHDMAITMTPHDSAAGNNLNIVAQNAAGTDNDGGNLVLSGGKETGTGTGGTVVVSGVDQESDAFRVDASDGSTFFRAYETATGNNEVKVCGDLHVTGTIFASSAELKDGAPTCSPSDERFKERVETLQKALQKILQLRGVAYHFKKNEFPDKNFPEGRQIGFIAQELEKVVPEVVVTQKEGYKYVDYDKLTALLVTALQEQMQMFQVQSDKVSTLEANADDIDSLRSECSELRARLELLENMLYLQSAKD